ncbi:GlsB/YeaQ/YmgE family stress response membrane protein [Motilibacter aurantiacus]|uniref:GlsB/YeaQ/YmgE family stress response membrane protein n=1 Tax=Motilibacter aurantiacus TaxID=2714955 RepID=UPI00140B8397|nr:GlsB/YeaQ/YmgE family stress response membrane protein [Motilibacter aurantiacus]NHC46108.1 GlsB/YeaQ/YmgE family stress response membrane protein [Motilibacter aurantiacus]
MDTSSLLGALGSGILVGLLGRLVAPGGNPIGCLFTILIGVVGAVAGLSIGNAIDAGGIGTFAIQVVVAAVLVSLVSALERSRRNRW